MSHEFLQDVLTWADFVLFFFFMCSVSYLLVFAIFSLGKRKGKFKKARKDYRFLIAFTTNVIDENIHKSIQSFLQQHFPKENVDLAVYAEKVSDSSSASLQDLPVTLVERQNGERFRSEMLEAVLDKMDSNYDIVVVMKAGDTVDPSFLEEINRAYHSGGMAIQAHRMLKKPKTSTAILSAVSEEINNSIFRRGHVNLGFSAGLIGSGMAFNYQWFRQNITRVKSVGLTKQLETILLKQGIFIEYLENTCTYDEKSHTASDFYEERQHWYSAQRYSLSNALRDFPKALLAGNFDFCDKIIQWILPSRFILLFFIALFAVAMFFYDWYLSIKWFGLLFGLFLVFDLSIPTRFQNTRTFLALFSMPVLLLSTFINQFRSVK
jgi:hypothetical protein